MAQERRHIPVGELQMGQRVYLQPAHTKIARGPKLDGDLQAGWVAMSPWLFGLVQRGKAHAFSAEPEQLSSEERTSRTKESISFRDELDADLEAQAAERAIKGNG